MRFCSFHCVDPESFTFVDSDVEQILAEADHINIIAYAEAMSFYLSSKSKENQEKVCVFDTFVKGRFDY